MKLFHRVGGIAKQRILPFLLNARVETMGSSGTPFLRKSRFTEFLIRENGLNERGFEGWVFYPGMLFNAADKWWGEHGKRTGPHEGLDLCLYADRWERIHSLDERTRIPAIYDGVIVKIFDDFLGKSVIMEHGHLCSNDEKHFTIYGHTSPAEGLHTGKVVREGEMIGTLAEPKKTKGSVPPHLHITLGLTPTVVSYEQFTWNAIGAPSTLRLFDPLSVIGWHHSTLDHELQQNGGQ